MDRLPLVTSAIVNVAQDVDEPWPIEVIGHDGKAYNVTMEPGEMVLYESHSVIHGRPFPMKGRFYANIFIHFEPTGHSLRHTAKLEGIKTDVTKQYKESVVNKQGGHEHHEDGLPSYIKAGSDEASKWKRSHPSNQRSAKKTTYTTGSTEAHTAASAGDVESLLSLIDKKKDIVHKKDANGWTPLHEGARAGHVEIVKTLVEKGADMNVLTGHDEGEGESALYLAIQEHGDDHPLVEFLESIGALNVGPEL